MQPIVNGPNGREKNGRFAAGNSGGPGNPYVRQTAQLRAALLRAVKEGDLEKAAAAVLRKAIKGDVIAFRELCDRLLGKPSSSDLVERVEKLESLIEERQHGQQL
jgi:hypothetical protein